MRDRIATALLALALGAIPAAAQEGIQLSWSDCGAMGVTVQAFACNTNSGTAFRVFGSARVATAMSPVASIASTLDLSVDAPSLPPWWQIRNAGTCRETAVTASVHAPGPMASCTAWEGGTTFDAFIVQEGYGGPNHSRLDIVQFGDPNNPVLFPADAENFLFMIQIGREKTVGPGSCSGCQAAACLTLRQVQFVHGSFSPEDQQTRVVTTPLASAGITWQSAAPSCLGAVPTPRSTWSHVKSLYR